MPGLFQGLELGKRALLTHQAWLQTIGHNIANVNTPGYTRQRVHISATHPERIAVGQVGTGVAVDDIRHVRDLFLGEQYREQSKSLSQWSYKAGLLSQVESMFAEPGDDSISALLNQFWDSWSDLSTNPSSAGNRVAVLEQANLLVNAIHGAADRLIRLREAIDDDVVNVTKDVNRLTNQIASLNSQIGQQELGGKTANDLRDQRDLLVDQLSQLVDVQTREHDNGEIAVLVGGMMLVDRSAVQPVTTKTVSSGTHASSVLTLGGTDLEINNRNGRLKGLVDARDEIIPRYLTQLNELAGALVQEVNALHRGGYGLNGGTGVDFFDPNFTDAAGIRINGAVELDPSRIAASASGEIGDNAVALALADLREATAMKGGTVSINDFYAGMIGGLGMETQEASSFTSNYEILVSQVRAQREAVEGVSLDEEMTNMIKFQHAYDAAARVITAMDQALDTVIFHMGLVGR